MTLLLITIGYVVGSIPTGLLLARRVGIDPRLRGSGNIGATNVLRSAGPRLGLLTLLGDTMKGTLPTLAAAHLAPGAEALAGLAAFIGHLFPVWLGFKGGKGVATALGVLLALDPRVAVIGIVVFAGVILMSGYVSLASILGSLAATAAVWTDGMATTPAVGIMAALITIRHAANVRRLFAGTEPRIGRPLFGDDPELDTHPRSC